MKSQYIWIRSELESSWKPAWQNKQCYYVKISLCWQKSEVQYHPSIGRPTFVLDHNVMLSRATTATYRSNINHAYKKRDLLHEDRLTTEFRLLCLCRLIYTDLDILHLVNMERVSMIHVATWQRKALSSVTSKARHSHLAGDLSSATLSRDVIQCELNISG